MGKKQEDELKKRQRHEQKLADLREALLKLQLKVLEEGQGLQQKFAENAPEDDLQQAQKKMRTQMHERMEEVFQKLDEHLDAQRKEKDSEEQERQRTAKEQKVKEEEEA